MAGKLTAMGVRALNKPGRYGDGGGLHLYVKDAARRTWVLRYMRDGKSRDMGLGAYPAVSLAEAREKADAARKLIRDGQDPQQARAADKAARAVAQERTFRAAAEALIADKAAGWRNPKHGAQWRATLEAYAYPAFGDRPVEEVDTAAVLAVLRPLWTRVPETASRLRGRIEAVLDAAKAGGWRTGENPARWKGHLAMKLPPARKVKPVENHPALPWKDMAAFMARLAGEAGVGPLALRFAILTAARSGEVRGMTWGEVDMEAAVWTVPAKRMKAGKLHRVPLSGSAMDLLRSVRMGDPAPGALVFPGTGRRGGGKGGPKDGADTSAQRPLSDMTLTMLLRRMERSDIHVHGFRSTFRDWAAECTPYPRDVVEKALAHSVRDKVEAAYQRADMLERRRPLMEEWAAWCEGAARRGATGAAQPAERGAMAEADSSAA
ncbi:integrase arm-type DNA-binding domain-containing protein [Roseomonas sp. NAR14]|uniref:Integrase arm-type DNA-binding domain-containing protein n=1 Tax=Roseomonas acroporae TaxID=2937791 RepID=A0A9X2BZM4_9PROT|nr:site-specific integrase [Roseomonas acroporae]MCK8788114.1 integrase arm-type DNA-binding domain-containing protein [Roseomonas acroporae]